MWARRRRVWSGINHEWTTIATAPTSTAEYGVEAGAEMFTNSQGLDWHAGRDSNPHGSRWSHSSLADRSRLPLRFEALYEVQEKQGLTRFGTGMSGNTPEYGVRNGHSGGGSAKS